jgi:flavin reductase (DIM6/NTAB) family NADH-FMN oxidoreductase RutF
MEYLDPRTIEQGIVERASAMARADGFRLAMRELASGISIVTAGHGDNRNGCTATSLCSFSMEPPSLLISLALTSSTLSTIRAHGAFGVSLLGVHHGPLADRFAGRTGVRGARRFEGAEWVSLVTGAPMLGAAIALFDCELDEMIERHTHAIVIGRVAATRAEGGPPLAHWRGQSMTLR